MARRLLKHDAVTLKELKKEIAQSYTPEIEVAEVDSVFDVKTWMAPVQEDISGHIYHHQFKIERNGGTSNTIVQEVVHIHGMAAKMRDGDHRRRSSGRV